MPSVAFSRGVFVLESFFLVPIHRQRRQHVLFAFGIFPRSSDKKQRLCWVDIDIDSDTSGLFASTVTAQGIGERHIQYTFHRQKHLNEQNRIEKQTLYLYEKRQGYRLWFTCAAKLKSKRCIDLNSFCVEVCCGVACFTSWHSSHFVLLLPGDLIPFSIFSRRYEWWRWKWSGEGQIKCQNKKKN